MKYRDLGKTGERVSALGFGAMRLPTYPDRGDEIDEPAVTEMLRYAVDHGVNYIDTAYVYHSGKGEGVVGKALADGYREKVLLATKLPIWNVARRGDCDRFLDEQLARLQTDRIDCYLLHCVQEKSWPKVRELGVLDWAEQARADGRIGHFGFSFHDCYETFVEIVDGYDWSFCQIQYNYVNGDFEVFNNATVFQGNTVALCRNLYRSQPEPRRASACAQCGQCEERCPQQIPVAEMLARVRQQFE